MTGLPAPEPPPRTPRAGAEKDLLCAVLDDKCTILLRKVAGLSEEDLRRAPTTSSLSLLGLVKHTAYDHQWWFRRQFAGEDIDFSWADEDPQFDLRPEPDETAEDIRAFFVDEVEARPRDHRRLEPRRSRPRSAARTERGHPPRDHAAHDHRDVPPPRPRRHHPRDHRRLHRRLTAARTGTTHEAKHVTRFTASSTSDAQDGLVDTSTSSNGPVYAMCMFAERLQILVSTEQRKRWEAEARRRGTSVSGLIRDAVDRHLGSAERTDRVEAIAGIRAMRGRFLAPSELDRLVEEERAKATDP